MAHEHGSAAAKHTKRMTVVLGITATILLSELVGAWLSHSLVLLADAGHMFADAAGIALALLAISVGKRPASKTRTFGYQRAEILAAGFNAVVLLGLSTFIIVEGIKRLITPPDVEPGIMLAFGIVAVIGNAVSLTILQQGQKESLNVRGAFLEVLSDLLGAAAVIVAAVLITVFSWKQADAVASLAIGIMIVPRTLKLLRHTVDVLLEATPKNIDLEQVRKHILELEGVVDVHDLHVWLITSGVPVISVHVVVDNLGQDHTMLDKLQACLKDHFDVEHSTFQLEPGSHNKHEHMSHE